MNEKHPFGSIPNCDDSLEALQQRILKLIEKNSELEQKYLEEFNCYAALERQYVALENRLQHEINCRNSEKQQVTQNLLSIVEHVDDKIPTLERVEESIEESLSHSWIAANNAIFKVSNRVNKLLQHTDSSMIHNIMEPLERSKGYLENFTLSDIRSQIYDTINLSNSIPPSAENMTAVPSVSFDAHTRLNSPLNSSQCNISASERMSIVNETLSPDAISAGVRFRLNEILNNSYQKFDVLVFAIIDYDYRYQRPQHIADYFAAAGHRVFYINSTFHREQVFRIQAKKENLFLVDLPNFSHDVIYSTDLADSSCETIIALENLIFQFGISDALLIADYPNWVNSLLHLKKRYGFTLVTDYMDDFGGFENNEQDMVVKSCHKLLKNSDFVVASSLYLKQQASAYNANVELIRNGTEFSHFHTAYGESGNAERKVIGYYGAISHWFDFEKIEYLSARFPQHDIVLIGDVTAEKGRLDHLDNVHLLGEKPYAVLPEYLKKFDVCLIPFDASISLIKATNPVKFYEYLSAAKKVVATEIPELEPFRDKYVYLANDSKLFGDYVELCLNEEDTLADAEECMRFARENDWKERIKKFVECTKQQFPKIKIIIDDRNLDSIHLCEETIRKNTAYPNYELVRLSVDPSPTISDCKYIVFLNNNIYVSRGWLTKMLRVFADTAATTVCPMSNPSLALCDPSDLPLHSYIYTVRNTFINTSGSDSPNDVCIMLSAESVQKFDLFNQADLIDKLREAGITPTVTNSVFVHKF